MIQGSRTGGRRRAALFGAAFAGFALTAASCSVSSDDDDEATEGAPAATQAPGGAATTSASGAAGEGTPDLAGQAITVLGSETGVEQQNFQSSFAPFETETGAAVTVNGSRDFTEQIKIQADGGNPPNIAIFPQPGLLADFVANGQLKPLPQAVVDEIDANFDPYWKELVTVDGQVYGIPVKSDVKGLVYYNTQAFTDGGYEIPTTQAEYTALIEQVKADGKVPFCVGIESGSATGWPFTDWTENRVLRIAGPDVYDQWVSHEIPFNDPQIVEAIGEVATIWRTEGNVYGGPETIASTGFGDAAGPFTRGECLMIEQANFYVNFITTADPAATFGEDGKYNVFYLPGESSDNQPLLVAGTFATMFSDDPATVAAMTYLASTDYVEARAALGGYVSANTNVAAGAYEIPFEGQLAGFFQDYGPLRFDGSDLMPGAVGSGSFWEGATNIVVGADPQDVADSIESSWPA